MNDTTQPPGRVIIVGSINDDLIVTVRRLPRPGETIHATDRNARFGGKGANQAVAASRFQGRTTLIGCVGHDQPGDNALANLRANGVDTTAIIRAAAPTGAAIVIVDEHGENEIVVIGGANQDLDADTVRRSLEQLRLRPGDVVGVGFEIPEHAVQAAVETVATTQAQLVVNPSPVRGLPTSITRCRSTLILNTDEALQLADARTPHHAAAQLATDFNARVVLTLGAEGALVVSDTDTTRIASLEVSATDTVGAGDTLFGAYCAQLAAGATPEHAVRLAVAAATLSVTSSGAQDGMPTLHQAETVLGK